MNETHLFYRDGEAIKIYKCDNLVLLRSMESESVNLIYCDILYNTGKKFDDYNDNLGSATEAVEWYRPRFVEMKRVLAANGSIFIHCNWRLDSYIRILMDEIFGEKNFRNVIHRRHSEKRGFWGNFDSQMDTILYYCKDSANFVFNENYTDGTPKTVPLFENGFIVERSEPRTFEGQVIDLASKNKHWMVSQKQFASMIEKGEVRIIDGLPYRFSTVQPIGNLWAEPEMLDPYSRNAKAEAYDTPKPEAVLERIIKSCSNEQDVVADFFLGGGTTAVVAKRLGRRGIYCDISEKACSVTVQKLVQMDK